MTSTDKNPLSEASTSQLLAALSAEPPLTDTQLRQVLVNVVERIAVMEDGWKQLGEAMEMFNDRVEGASPGKIPT